MSYDQLDVTAVAGAELVFRGLVRLETAIGRNPRAPDFSGLEDMLISGTTDSGGAITASFTEWFANRQKNKAQVMKQQRLYKEEVESESKNKKGKNNKDNIKDGDG